MSDTFFASMGVVMWLVLAGTAVAGWQIQLAIEQKLKKKDSEYLAYWLSITLAILITPVILYVAYFLIGMTGTLMIADINIPTDINI